MGNLLRTVDWTETNEMMKDLLHQEASITVHPMDQGFEAEVVKLSWGHESFVLKIWNKGSYADVRFQFHLLNLLAARGLSVSRPVGWGTNRNAEKVLLTSFDGTPVATLDEKKLADLAKLLSAIHQTPMEDLGDVQLPRYDFTDYFFPGVREHPDLHRALEPLVRTANVKQERMIHGDFHLGNLVEDSGRFTVIDWTNGQCGDPRYDFAWSLALKRIYLPKPYADAFRSAYLDENPIPQEELEVFEALACLRWILLDRRGGVPRDKDAMKRIAALLAANRYLQGLELGEVPIELPDSER